MIYGYLPLGSVLVFLKDAFSVGRLRERPSPVARSQNLHLVSNAFKRGSLSMDVATSLILRGFVAGCGCGCVALAIMVAWSAFAKTVNSI